MRPTPYARRWLLLLLAVTFLFIHRHQWAVDLSRSGDDASYLSHALTVGLDFDLDYSNEPGHPYATVFADPARPDRPVPRHFFGAGVMAAPFVAAFSAIDRLTGHPVIADHRQYRHSWSFFGFSVAVHVYFFAAITLLWRAARLAGAPFGPLAVTALCLSSGVAFYVLSRMRMTHGFEFFAFAGCVHAGAGLWRSLAEGRRVAAWIAWGVFGSTLAIAIRLNNLQVMALPALTLLLLALARRAPAIGRTAAAALAALATAPVGLLALLPMHFALYGAALPDIKAMHGTHGGGVPMPTSLEGAQTFIATLAELLHHTGYVVWGGEFGLLFTNPLAVIGLILAAAVAVHGGGGALLRLTTVLLLLLYALTGLAVTLMWKNTGHSYGWRYLLPLFPLGFVGLCAWWPTAAALPRRVVTAVLSGLGVVAVVAMLLFGKSPGLSYEWRMSRLGVETQTAPDFLPNLAREAFTGAPWSVATKDGIIGYANKATTQHPPVVGLWLALLFALWMGWGVWVTHQRK
ncbi:MAG: hypothetical protein HY985_10015 [Magnetospirillum sp.]|nr:hypothetical protein [Magnetospirillum sp.]